jgi:hypothetical protein
MNSIVGWDAKSFAWLVALVLFLAPISSDIGGGTSINYAFVILLIVAPWGYRYSIVGAAYCICLGVSYLAGIFLFSEGDEAFLVRQFASFIVMLLPAMLLFVRFQLSIDKVSKATIIASCVYSGCALYAVWVNNFSLADIYFIKGNLRDFISDWPQRYVVVLMLGFFLSYERIKIRSYYVVTSLLILTVIFLSFTRAAYLSMLVGGLGYLLCARFYELPQPPIHKMHRFSGFFGNLQSVIFIGAVFVMLSNDAIWHGLSVIIDAMTSGIADSVTGNMTADNESESTRLDIWTRSVQFVLENNPLLGSGLAGGYLIFNDDFYGSAHSQYIDVFLRTGLIGSIIYLLLWFQLLVGAFRVSPGLFGGMLAILVFGLFHETTKLSYGAFLFFIFLNLVTEMSQSRSRSNRIQIIS